jgi:hypothetical protein
VPSGDPAATSTSSSKSPYDFQGEAQSPPPPAVTSDAASGVDNAPPNLDTPAPAQLDAPAVQVQDLPAPAPQAAPAMPPSADAPSTSANAAGGSTNSGGANGYRVQILATADAEAADRMRREVESRLGTRAYVAYQAPYFKVRVGNCASSDDCRDLQARLRNAGYDTVWIVADQIEP